MSVCAVLHLSSELLSCCRPVYGLIFLFKWQQEEKKDDGHVAPEDAPEIFFAKQVLSAHTQVMARVDHWFGRSSPMPARLRRFSMS